MKRNDKQKRLKRAGWTAGSATDFHRVEPEEASFIELKLALAAGIREVREKSGLTQTEVAARLGSSQSRVAKMEAGVRSVSLDLLVKSLLGIGASPTAIARWIRRAENSAPSRVVICDTINLNTRLPSRVLMPNAFSRRADTGNCSNRVVPSSRRHSCQSAAADTACACIR